MCVILSRICSSNHPGVVITCMNIIVIIVYIDREYKSPYARQFSLLRDSDDDGIVSIYLLSISNHTRFFSPFYVFKLLFHYNFFFFFTSFISLCVRFQSSRNHSVFQSFFFFFHLYCRHIEMCLHLFAFALRRELNVV